MHSFKWALVVFSLISATCLSTVPPAGNKILSSAVGWYENTYNVDFAPLSDQFMRAYCPSGQEATACSCWAENTKALSLMSCEAEGYLGPGVGPRKLNNCKSVYYNPSSTSKTARISVKAYCQ
eukprot:CAMPEP_0184681690 /NCGR_PEP_ID=MMETSP0312-20130426/4678_1 /TAXON_ID=31354 /ORGANISM="Compsopogon coeruleus, Strain SAG 36.94" /LENGTH=122 /DNA_ID=CAMNT_0027132691 /DNA_START=117 /DNA_END=485 /DNA_ORIENTATION=+